MYRLASLIVAGAVIVAGFAVYAAPPAADPGDDPPVLLKKKGAPDIEDPLPPAAEAKDKKPADAPKPDADKGGEPDQPQQDPEEVLKRVDKTMRSVEERLANKELNDGTRQMQDDALKDLDSLIDLTENPPPSKDDQNNDQSNPSDSSKSDSSKSGASKSGSSGSSMSKSGSSGSSSGSSGKGGRKGSRKGHGGSQPGNGGMGSSGKQPADGQPNQQPGDPSIDKSAVGGNGGGGKDVPTAKDQNADLYKDVWGHLPETLRAEMNAYSNTKGFMPEYEALISKYYRTIAEQGRRKGD